MIIAPFFVSRACMMRFFASGGKFPGASAKVVIDSSAPVHLA